MSEKYNFAGAGRLLICLVGAGFFGQPFAEPVQDVTTVVVPVADQSETTRAAAMATALIEVLPRLGSVAAEAQLAAMADLQNYVIQYQYRIRPGLGLSLVVEFNQQSLADLLQRQGGVVWGEERPLTYLWVAYLAADGTRGVIHSNSANEVTDSLALKAVKTVGQRYAMPLRWPEQAEDAVSAYPDIVVNLHDVLLTKAQQPGVSGVVIAYLHEPIAGQWEGRCTLVRNGMSQPWSTTGDSLSQTIDFGLRSLRDIYLSDVVKQPLAPEPRSLNLVVRGVVSLPAYVSVLRKLESHKEITQIQVLGMEGDRLVLRITVQAEPTALRQLLTTDRLLESLPGVLGSPEMGTSLELQLHSPSLP